MSNVYGKRFCVTTWGESHGKALGVIVDGCPAGLMLNESDIQTDLDRRKPGNSPFATKRTEADLVEIMSGVFEEKTTGTPISLIIYNKDQRMQDYGEIAQCFRPGHADYGFTQKFGFRDYRGGGRSSGRETAARVAAGAIAKKILLHLGITVNAYTLRIGEITVDRSRFDLEAAKSNSLVMPDKIAAEKAAVYLTHCIENKDSAGGIIECIISGVKTGIGEPVFDKLDACLAKAIMSIGAVKGIEFGDGFLSAKRTGSENNDEMEMVNGAVQKTTNHSGGILGGISDGADIIFRAAVKPTPSISLSQKTVDLNGNNRELVINGRHDPVIVPRAVVVVEAMAAITLLDLLLIGMTSRLDHIESFYRKITTTG